MEAYLGLRDSWLLEDDPLLDSIEALQAQADGTFYPTGRGPESCAGIACRDLWGYLVPSSEAEAFERLFLTHEDERIAKLYAKRFAYARWRDGAEGKPEVSFFPAPRPQRDTPSGQRRQEGHLGTLLVVGSRRRAPLRHALRSCHGQMLRRDRFRKRDAPRRPFPSRRGKDRAIRHHRRRRPLR